MTHYIGIDSGSTMCKAALLKAGQVVDTYVVKTGWNPKRSAMDCLNTLREKHALAQPICVAATGYGREAIDFADYVFTEITCHAFGGMFLVPEIQGIIDIGGQDSKVIQTQRGKVVNFLMNDKCAAGTGRFLSMACETLEIVLNDIDNFADISQIIPVNSMCAVFAESEIIGLLAMEKDRRQIIGGVLHSIAQRIRQLTSKIDFDADAPLLMTGGLSRFSTLREIITGTISHKVVTHEHALFAGAIGACVCAEKKASM